MYYQDCFDVHSLDLLKLGKSFGFDSPPRVELNIYGLELEVVLDHYEAMETYSRIGLLRSYGNLQSYSTKTKLWKLTVVLDY